MQRALRQHHFSWGTTNKIAGAFALLCGFSAILWAAGGALSGIVTGANGTAISGAHVVAVSASQGLQTKASTDAKGAYRFPVLAVGQYDLKVEAPGYKPAVHKIVIHVDDKARVDIVLEPDAPPTPEAH
jgi:Carboxypeptidase regulatory-like domain